MQAYEPAVIRTSSRLEAYSDAIFSIVATVMILPIAHTELPDDQDLGPSFLHHILPQLGVYVFTFFIICHTWDLHIGLFNAIEKVDEFTVLLNLALMLIITFLPFTFTLLGQYPLEKFAIWLFCGTIILVSVLKFFFVLHAFLHPEVLEDHIRNDSRRASYRNRLFALILTPAIIAAIASLLTIFSPNAGSVFLLLILFGNFIRRKVIVIYHKIIERFHHSAELEVEHETSLRTQLLSEIIPKERIECFSDGVFAIVATLIILDICEDNIPTQDEVKKAGSLEAALSKFSADFLAYAGTFVTVALLWYVHHSLLYYIKELNKLMVILNNMCLLFVGMSPLTFKLASTYDDIEHRVQKNETMSIQLSCIVIFFASFFQATLWVTGLMNQQEYINREGWYDKSGHIYMSAKLIVYPMLTVVVYILSFASYEIKTEAFNGMQIGALGLFLLFQAVYSIYKRAHHQYEVRFSESADNEIIQTFNEGRRSLLDYD